MKETRPKKALMSPQEAAQHYGLPLKAVVARMEDLRGFRAPGGARHWQIPSVMAEHVLRPLAGALTTEQVAQCAGITRAGVQYAIKSGSLPAVRVDPAHTVEEPESGVHGSRQLILPKDLETWLETRRVRREGPADAIEVVQDAAAAAVVIPPPPGRAATVDELFARLEALVRHNGDRLQRVEALLTELMGPPRPHNGTTVASSLVQ
jgi:hypothetical protein